jgi:hypothetical protein
MTGTPPRREPHYFWNEQYGWTLDACARGLIQILCGFVHSPGRFTGSAVGRAWIEREDGVSARIAFASDKGDGHVELTAHDSHWVKIEVFVAGAPVFRAWCEEVWEEKEFWPDGSDGITPPDGDAPGRISKRGSWLNIRCAFFPGVPDDGTGYWSLEVPE